MTGRLAATRRRALPLSPEGESGLTLIELLITVLILGLAIVAILGGMVTMLSTSGLHRRQADVGSVVENAAEAVKSAAYASCATSYVTPASSQGDVNQALAGTGSLHIRYWNGTAFVSTCPTPDQGLQMVPVTATSTDGSVTQTIYVVKANR